MKKRLAKVFFSIGLLYISLPTITMANSDSFQDAYDTVPWYARPFVFIIDLFLGILGGVKDPMDHVFNNGCSELQYQLSKCPELDVFGMWTSEQFETAIYRGFWLMFIVVVPMVTMAITKSGILLSLRNITQTAKFQIGDFMIKALLGFILLTQFFNILGAVFSFNNTAVDLFESDLKGNISIADGQGNVISRSGEVITTDRISMDDLTLTTGEGTNGLDDVIITLASRGISIWWEFFYLQRAIMISILVILAPIWIACLFFPNFSGITITAMKEVWSQIIAQLLHAALFWLFFQLFDETMTWLHVLVAMCIFIPISESVRFLFGATSNTGSKLAMAGTAVGLGAMMNLGGAVASVYKGGSNAYRVARGLSVADKAQGIPRSEPGGFDGIGTRNSSPSNTVAPLHTGREKTLRAMTEIGAGLGSAALRMGGMTVGSGAAGGIGGYMAGKMGATVGESVGYRAGAVTFAGGAAAVSGVKKAKNLPSEYSKALSALEERGEGSKLSAAGIALRGGIDEHDYRQGNLPTEKAREMDAQKLEQSAGRWGVAGDIAFGRGGFQRGDAYARKNIVGRALSSNTLSALKDKTGLDRVYTIESNASSVLATKNSETGEYVPISNYGKGNASLGMGETVVSEYSLSGSGNNVQMLPVMQSIDLKNENGHPIPKEVPNKHIYTSTGTRLYDKPTQDPYSFLKARDEKRNQVDVRRRMPSLIKD